MDAKLGACYYNADGIYNMLGESNYYIFLNAVFPASIKELNKILKLKKEYTLQVIGAKSFIKVAALRDANYMLSFLYPRGFITKVSSKDVELRNSFVALNNILADVGEIVSIKISPFVIVTVDFWANKLYYGKYKDSFLVLSVLINLIKWTFSFNYMLYINLSNILAGLTKKV